MVEGGVVVVEGGGREVKLEHNQCYPGIAICEDFVLFLNARVVCNQPELLSSQC